ncbi:MAG: TerC family protein [Alphaproteobacteria bacterium]|nr:TerC family protein [Alphaproteobacteria bacterium]MBF0128810.1 TerC family protein [Alphaproteobacteria bacterium]
MDWMLDPQMWISLLTLAGLEIVLGVDNLVFLTILADRLPAERRAKARRVGLIMALGTRLALLATLSWIAGMTAPLFTVLEQAVSWRDLILIGGGLFLLAKATHEIHVSVEGGEDADATAAKVAAASFAVVVVQMALFDIIFSLDSVITAVGMVNELPIMVAAIVIAIIVMLVASGPLGDFVSRHPTVKMLALSFLILVGMALIGDGMGFHIPKGYLYFAMGFSVAVEALNIAARRKAAVKDA